MDIRKFFGSPTTTKGSSSGSSAKQPAVKSPAAKSSRKNSTSKDSAKKESAKKDNAKKNKQNEKNNNTEKDDDVILIDDSSKKSKNDRVLCDSSEHSNKSRNKDELNKKDNQPVKKEKIKKRDEVDFIEETPPKSSEKKERKSRIETEKVKKDSRSRSADKEKKEKGEEKKSRRKSRESKHESESEEEKVEISKQSSAEKKNRSRKKISSDEEEEFEIKKSKKKGKSKASKKSNVILDSDSGEEEAPLPDKPKAKRKRKSEVTYVCDSDEEPQRSIMHAFSKVTPTHKKPAMETPKAKTKTVSVADFFGGATVHQSEKKTASVKRKAPEKTQSTDMSFEMHDDDDFEKTLLELDMREPQNKKARTETDDTDAPIPDTPVRRTTPKKRSPKPTQKTCTETSEEPKKEKSLSTKLSKLAERAKCDTNVVMETPEKDMPKLKKKSPEKSPTDTPKLERKGTGYRSYLNREGPRALGSKEIPEGGDNCLEDLTFVLTGVYESIEREEAKSLIEKYGGKVTTSLSKKTSYLVAGRDAGESKMAKAQQFGTKQVDEDGLLELIRTRPGKKSKYVIAAEKEAAKTKSPLVVKSTNQSPLRSKTVQSVSSTPTAANQSRPASQSTPTSTNLSSKFQHTPSTPTTPKTVSSPVKKSSSQSADVLLWVDKYKPPGMKQIIGQQGDKSNARKLLKWLQGWHKNQAAGKKPAFNRFSDDGSGHKAALLSGPPGVGKTTTAQLVCQEAGFSYVELNASDTRSKKSLQNEVLEALNNHTLMDYMGKSEHEQKGGGHRHCLIMDEVDGMAGNEDRGGIQELVHLIKNSKIPIITMCNDRNAQKMRTLSNHCFDLRFQRPRVEQIKAAMMSVAFKEGLKIPPPALNEIILGANQDVRQILHNMEMWSKKDKVVTYEQAQKDAKKAKKDTKIGPFDAGRLVFVGGEEKSKMSIDDKAELFFYDYSLAPLFVQENYIHVSPYEARGDVKKHLDLLSQAADSICDGDLVDRYVRAKGNWGLLPTQAIFASVIPGDIMRGNIGQMISFPSWLGKNSTTNKVDRILQELKSHMRLKLSADKAALNMDYLPHLRNHLTSPFLDEGSEGVPKVISFMDDYDIVKDDFDNILEISQWPNRKDPMSMVESKVKAAFTRTYNKESHMTPYSIGVAAKKKKSAPALDDLDEGTQPLDESGNESDDITNDAMIKQKKKPEKGKGQAKAKTSTAKPKSSTAKGKTGGRGRAKKS